MVETVSNPTPAQFLAAWGAPGAGLVGPAGQAVMPIGVIATPPAWEAPYPEAVPFLNYGTATVNSAVATAVSSQFQMPAGATGWVRSLVLQALNISATSALYFQLQVNGAPVPGWGQIPVLPGAFAVWSYAEDRITVRLVPGATAQLFAVVTDGNSYQVSAQLSGWHVDTAVAKATDIWSS